VPEVARKTVIISINDHTPLYHPGLRMGIEEDARDI